MKLRPLTIGLAGVALILVALAAGCGDDDNGGEDRENAGTAVIDDMTYDFDVTLCSAASADSYRIEGRGTTSDDKPILVTISSTQNGTAAVIVGVNQASAFAQPERQFSMLVTPGNSTVEVGPTTFSLRATGTVTEVQHVNLPQFPAEVDLSCLL